MAGLCLCAAFLVIAAAAAAADKASFQAERKLVAKACKAYQRFDINEDGLIEIKRLRPVMAARATRKARQERGTVVVLVEERLLEYGRRRANLRPALRGYLEDLAADGYDAHLVKAAVYGGKVHQDGRTVLALRRLFQRVKADVPDFAGAVLVGNFPEACIVRQYYWHKHTDITLNAKTKNEKKFKDVDYVRDRAELVAGRAELILADLDGRWEEVYVQEKRSLPYFIAVYPGGERQEQLVTADYEFGEDTFEDFFFVHDGKWKQEDVGGGKLRFSAAGGENDECAPADLERPNPMARPDIMVSRINARHVGVRPKRGVVGVNGEGLLDGRGLPQSVTFANEKKVPSGVKVWEHDEATERRLLLEFFDRNHRYRQGEFRSLRKPASLVTEFGSGLPAAKQAFAEWARFGQTGYDVRGKNTQLIEAVRWLRRPALLRFLKAHSDPWGSTFAKTEDIQALEEACGGTVWGWHKQGKQLVPTLAKNPGKLDFSKCRSLWANGLLPDCASMYTHTGCEGITPEGAASRPYTDPSYGYWQGAETLLFYCNGIVLIGRAKVFYDEPRELCQVLAGGGNWGDGWRHYFEVESAAQDVDEVGGGIGRKRAYFWSVLGDWTVTMYPKGVRPPHRAVASGGA
ncbi:MAG: hypothetical protein ACE5R4_04985 [Armatimonadota bacterium]